MAGTHAVQMPLTLLFIEPHIRSADRPPPYCLLDSSGSIAGSASDSGWAIWQLYTSHLNSQLVLGAATFGIGWALSCACPGPDLLRIVAHEPGSTLPSLNN
eukprot:1305745-Rhodomonas_salina.1